MATQRGEVSLMAEWRLLRLIAVAAHRKRLHPSAVRRHRERSGGLCACPLSPSARQAHRALAFFLARRTCDGEGRRRLQAAISIAESAPESVEDDGAGA
jgi:hypothetical protein